MEKQECIPVGCVLFACCPYLPACTAPGGRGVLVGGVPGLGGVPGPGGVPGLGGTCPGIPPPPCGQNDGHV